MNELIGKRVTISDVTGYTYHGVLEEGEFYLGVHWMVLADWHQVHYQDLSSGKPTNVDQTKGLDKRRFAAHHVVGISPSPYG